MTPDAHSHKKRIFIVDDHPLVREWLTALINQQSDLVVCGESDNAADALRLIGAAKPHVAMLEISVEADSGIELIKRIQAACPPVPAVAVIVLSERDDVTHLQRALHAGARGCITKREATANVLEAIRCVLQGRLYLSNKWAATEHDQLAGKIPPGMKSQLATLSQRELEVFQLLGRCSGTRQIAQELQISYKTVQTFYARIKTKLKLANVTELLREAVRWHDSRQKL
jgi:DNA-binding NarL/FixJ family response regulator